MLSLRLDKQTSKNVADITFKKKKLVFKTTPYFSLNKQDNVVAISAKTSIQGLLASTRSAEQRYGKTLKGIKLSFCGIKAVLRQTEVFMLQYLILF